MRFFILFFLNSFHVQYSTSTFPKLRYTSQTIRLKKSLHGS